MISSDRAHHSTRIFLLKLVSLGLVFVFLVDCQLGADNSPIPKYLYEGFPGTSVRGMYLLNVCGVNVNRVVLGPLVSVRNSQEGTARVKTALGELDTIIVSSRRAGNNRILRMWFAPSLGFVPVQAERTRDGKLEFAMRIKTLNR